MIVYICPLTDEWIKKLWYIYIMEYYSAIKRNKLESTVVREKVSQKEKNKFHILMHLCGIEKYGLMNLVQNIQLLH